MAAAERAKRYAEAMGLPSHHAAYPNARARVGAVMEVADAELAELRARVEGAEAAVARVEALTQRDPPRGYATHDIRAALDGR